MSAEPGSERDALERKHALMDAVCYTEHLSVAARAVHRLNDHFYRDIHTGALLAINPGEKIALIHSEISEMLEGARKGEMDAHLPNRKSEEVEAADALIRLLDYCGWRELDLAGAVADKLKYNTVRKDHTNEARRADGGKKF
jgi:hypothetical protein